MNVRLDRLGHMTVLPGAMCTHLRVERRPAYEEHGHNGHCGAAGIAWLIMGHDVNQP